MGKLVRVEYTPVCGHGVSYFWTNTDNIASFKELQERSKCVDCVYKDKKFIDEMKSRISHITGIRG